MRKELLLTKALLILQMKRALEILERSEELRTFKKVNDERYSWTIVDREVTELKITLREIRRNSVKLQNEL